MSSAWSQLEQMLTCAICLDKFKNPRLLPCQHSFCGDACMEGLVDYARRQIKCPECRAEHRIPYQGVASLPSNVTLIRFLELHARITGEEPEPVPTFMEKCSVCGEKIEGVQRCAHCDKKVCPECKEAHVDLLRREISRINGQAKRCLGKLQDFKETLARSEERLRANHKSVRREIEDSCRRLIDDLQLKQKKLCDEVDVYVEQEQKTIDKLKVAVVDELATLESNSQLAEEKLTNKFQWTDQELSEMKEIYAKAMEFVRLFDPEIGDYTRKMRFSLIPEFETMRRRLCELGELKFAETAASLMASSLQYCNATGATALELCNAAASQAAAALANAPGVAAAANYGLSHSSSNSNLGAGGQLGGSNMLELPSMTNALMRSQSDHRLASQFQARLKQQQQEAAAAAAKSNGSERYADRYGVSSARRDYETDSIRSRYAPAPRASIGGGAAKDYAADLLRDWPRPGDTDPSSDLTFGSSIHFKSAFMRRKEKERQQYYGAGYQADNNDDDDLASEASYGGLSTAGRSVRFYDGAGDQQAAKQVPRVFDCKEAERAPLSGVPKLGEAPHFQERLHQMGAKSAVDKRLAEEEGRRDKDLVESARLAMSKSVAKAAQRQASEDEVEKQKRANKHAEAAAAAEAAQVGVEAGREHSPTPAAELTSSASTVVEAGSQSQPTPPASPAATNGGRRGLYGQAVNERSKRQLSNAIQDAAAYTTRRKSLISSSTDSATPADRPATPEPASPAAAATTSGRPRRTLRSAGRSSSSKQSAGGSIDRQQSLDGASATTRRRRTLARAESSAQSSANASTASEPQPAETSQSKNYSTGSGGTSDSTTTQSRGSESLPAGRQQDRAPARVAGQTPATTEEASDNGRESADEQLGSGMDTVRRRAGKGPGLAAGRAYSRGTTASSSFVSDDEEENDKSNNNEPDTNYNHNDDDDDEDTSNANDELESEEENDLSASGSRKSREFIPSAVNRLLDRSAQIRKDSKEQQSRGNSPQRDEEPRHGASSAHYSARPSTTGYSPRQRLAYQRSQSIRGADDEDSSANSSLYTTASSGAAAAGSGAGATGHRSSLEDEHYGSSASASSRRMSGNSSDRTLTSATSGYERPSYTRRESASGDSTTGGFQSRFLARSRTSAALSQSQRSQEADSEGRHAPAAANTAGQSAARSYLSSRDRFMQSAALMSEPRDTTPASSVGAYSYSRANSGGAGASASSPSSSAGPIRTHSEYLRNKFNSRRSSSNSSSSSATAALLRSRSSHSSFLHRDSNDDDLTGNTNDPFELDNNSDNEGAISERSFGSRRGSLAGACFEAAGPAQRSVYATKGRMLFKLGSRGANSGNFTWPRGVAVGLGARGREIVVADSSNHRVQLFDANARFLNEFGTYGSGPGEFDCLAGVAISRLNKNYIVSDRYNHRVQLFDMSGKFLRSFGDMGRDTAKFNLPWGVAADTSGQIYVCDKENHRIQVFDADGNYVSKFGSPGSQPGQLQHPHYIATGYGGRVVVTDTNNHRVQVFDSSGRLMSTIGREGSGSGQFKFPRGVAMDDLGYIIVGDSGNNRLQIFTPEGSFVKSIGTWGSAEGEFKGIEGVAVDSNYNILVCDRENHRIQVF